MKNIFKTASLLSAAVMMLLACEGNVDPEQSGTGSETGGTEVPGTKAELTLSADNSFIQSNGTDKAKLTVKLDDKVVTDGVTFYDESLNVLDIKDFTFTAEEDGQTTIIAAYQTYKSNDITITAIPVPVPSTVADPDPSNTSFVKKVQVTKFTGTGCGNCPIMNQKFREAEKQSGIYDKIVLASAHTYNSDDPAYLPGSIGDAMGVTGHPYVVFDMELGFNNYNSPEMLAECVAIQYAKPAKAGISVNSVYSENTVVVKATVKASEDGEYCVGAWLLQDGIYSAQTSAIVKEDNYHDGCIRVAQSNPKATIFSGYPLGFIKAGETADYVFVMNVNTSWKVESPEDELHLNIFVSAESSGYYSVTNVIDCPIDAQTPFAYAE